MKIREEAKQPISPLNFWVAVLLVVLLLGGMGLVFMRTGKVPSISRLAWGLPLLLIWGSNIVAFFRHGRRAFSRVQIVTQIGYTLLAGGHLMPHQTWLAICLENFGAFLLVFNVFFMWVDFSQHKKSAPPDPVTPAP